MIDQISCLKCLKTKGLSSHPSLTVQCPNRFIGSQPPSVYLARLVDEQGISKQRLNEILRSHHIEPKTLWNDDFDAFLDSRMGDLSLLIEEMMGFKLARGTLVGIK